MFSNDFEFEDKKEGFKTYIQVSCKMMAKFNLNRILNMYEAICLNYQSIKELEEDEHPSKTKQIHDLYTQKITLSTGIPEDWTDNPSKYKYFMLTRIECDKYNIPYTHWINSQFEAFEWQKKIPDPIQLVGPKSTQRFNKYAKKEGLDISVKRPTKQMNFSKILGS